MAQHYTRRGGIWVPSTDEDHRADTNPHPGIVVLEGDARLTNARTPTAHASTHYDGQSDELDILQLGGYSGDSNDILDGSGVFRTPSYANIWDARAVPTGLHAHSDEFSDGSVAAGWLDWDHGAWITTSEESPPNQLVHVGTGPGVGVHAGGKYKAIPSGEFQFIAYCALDTDASTTSTQSVSCGVFVAQDATDAAGDLVSIDLTCNNPATSRTNVVSSRVWTAYNTSPSNVERDYLANGVWLRMRTRVDSSVLTSYWTDWSSDGVRWQQLRQGANTVAWEAKHYGLYLNTLGTTSVVRVAHQHFRVWSGAGASAFNFKLNGNYLAA